MKRKTLSVLVVVMGAFMLLAAPASAGIRALYYFEDGPGAMAMDSSGFGNNAGLNNMDTVTAWGTVTLPDTQPYSGVLEFDGVDDYLLVPYDATLNPQRDITVQYWAWVDTAANGTDYVLHRNSGAFQSRVSSDLLNEPGLCQFGVSFYYDQVGAMTLWQLGRSTKEEWHHVAGVADGTTFKLYIDGVLNNTTFTPGVDLRQFSQPLWIGRWAGSAGWDFQGKLDEVCIMDYAESEARLGYYRHIPPPPGIETTVLPFGYVWVDYMETITASGGVPPYEFSVIGGALPNGLALTDTVNGIISGWSDVADSGTFTIQVTDSEGATNDWTYTVYIHDNPDTIALPKKGWNAIGTGRKDDMPYSGMYVVSGSTRKTMAQAETAGWIHGSLYYFDDGVSKAYKTVPGDAAALLWEHGYWLWTWQDNLTLILQ